MYHAVVYALRGVDPTLVVRHYVCSEPMGSISKPSCSCMSGLRKRISKTERNTYKGKKKFWSLSMSNKGYITVYDSCPTNDSQRFIKIFVFSECICER